MADDDYVKNLENIIQRMLTPLKDIPFPLVIKAISGHEVVPFNPSDTDDSQLLNQIEKAVIDAGNRMVLNGVYARRVNEIGNAGTANNEVYLKMLNSGLLLAKKFLSLYRISFIISFFVIYSFSTIK